MSNRHSWLAIKGIGDDELLGVTGLGETGELGLPLDEAHVFSYGSTASGWTIVFANCFDLRNSKVIDQLSRRGQVLLCDFQDGLNEPTARIMAAQLGNRPWDVSTSMQALSIWGNPPPELAAIHERYKPFINDDRLMMDELVFELGRALCGFRHDQEQRFKILQRLPDSPLTPFVEKAQAPNPVVDRVISFVIRHSIWLVVLVLCLVWLLDEVK